MSRKTHRGSRGGRRIAKAAPANPTGELGVLGLDTTGGTINEEFLRNLRGDRGRKIYREMSENDPSVASILFAIEMPLREAEYNFTAGEEGGGDDEVVDFLNSNLDDMSQSWEDVLSQILTMIPFGWSYFEVVYKQRLGLDFDPRSRYDDGLIGIRKLALRAQDTLRRWQFDEQGGLQAMVQRSKAGGDVIVPIEKSLLFRTRADKGNPEGRSVLRPAYKPWYFKTQLEKLEAIALERMGAGFPVVRMPRHATDAEKTLAKSIARRTRLDEQMGITLPGPPPGPGQEGWGFELVAPAAGRGVGEAFHTSILRYRTEIQMSVLASFIGLGTQQGTGGSRALSGDHREFFTTAIEGWAHSITAVINRFLVPTLLELNGLQTEQIPELEVTKIKKIELGELGQFVKALSDIGVPMDDLEATNILRSAARLPEISQEEFDRRADEKRQREEQEREQQAQRFEQMAISAGRGNERDDEETLGDVRKFVSDMGRATHNDPYVMETMERVAGNIARAVDTAKEMNDSAVAIIAEDDFQATE